MATKRPNEMSVALVPAPVSKKTKSEIVAYAAKNRRPDTRSSSLFAPIVTLSGHEGEIFCGKFSPDGVILATAGFDRKIFLWNVYGECENWVCLAGHSGAITDLKFNYDGSELITTSTDKSVCIWDINSCERIKRIKAHTDFANSVDVARHSPHVFCSASDDGTVKVWDRRKRTSQASHATTFNNSPFQVLSVCFGANEHEVISGGIDNDIKVWDVRKPGTECAYAMRGHVDSVTGLAMNPEGTHVLSNSMDNCLRIWDVRAYVQNPDQRCVNLFYGHSHNFEKNLLRVAWSPDSQLISSGSADKFLYIWEVETAKIAYKLPGHTGSINDVDFHPNEPIIASSSSDRKVFLGEL